MGAYYTNLSSAPRWFKKTLFPILKTSRTTRFTVFFFLLVFAVAASVWGGSYGPLLLLSITFLGIGIAEPLSVVLRIYMGNHATSHKGKPWVIEEGTSEQVEIVHHQALASPVSTGLPKTHQSPKEAYSKVPEHDGGDGGLGTHYTDFSSAPRWFKTLLPIRPVIRIFFFFFLILVWSSGGWLLGIGMMIIYSIFTSLFKSLYGEPCDASHKGKPWVIEHYKGGGGGGFAGGDGGGCGGGGCGGD